MKARIEELRPENMIEIAKVYLLYKIYHDEGIGNAGSRNDFLKGVFWAVLAMSSRVVNKYYLDNRPDVAQGVCDIIHDAFEKTIEDEEMSYEEFVEFYGELEFFIKDYTL